MMNILGEIYIIRWRERERIPKVRARRQRLWGKEGQFRTGVQVRCITSVGFVKGYCRKIRQVPPDISHPPSLSVPFLAQFDASEIIITRFRQNQCILIVATREIILGNKIQSGLLNCDKMGNIYSYFSITCNIISSSRTFLYSKSRIYVECVRNILLKHIKFLKHLYEINVFKAKIFVKNE